ncbi:MAG: nicotinamide-nucleotide amidohydrolase family protein, partial [Bacteroidetes bacterium]|nr:nicotinamide-nucleotide amidohydrolase family protein [Bacteroidota bacterium]
LKVALAESCTGGRIAGRLTDIAGSSDYVLGGVVAYDNTVKVEVLGVSSETIETHGAVSRHVALEMADGVRHRLKADIGLSSTGIMGPGGGSEEKPVGTVWIGYADEQSASAVKIMLAGDRDGNREQATTIALNLVRLRLLKRKH